MRTTNSNTAEYIRFQRNEITESIVYNRLAAIEKDKDNASVLRQIAQEERAHYQVLKKYSHCDVKPDKWRIIKYYWLAKLFGITFAIKLMESGEENAHGVYGAFSENEELQRLSEEEGEHENRLIALINEERLEYMGSVVLGLNDALVEFTGVLAGFTLALSDSKLIALTGSITGIAAALSMGSSEYLSTKSEAAEGRHPGKAAFYTSVAYIITVISLIAPFIIFSNVIVAMFIMFFMAILIIAVFNYYYSVARSDKFRKRFMEMATLSFSVAALSFVIGYLLKQFTGIDA